MSEMWKPKPDHVIRDWIEQCLEKADDLTKWEYDFVTSLAEQIEYKPHLSERQEEILERIYAEKT